LGTLDVIVGDDVNEHGLASGEMERAVSRILR
jgi:hypothetical protein